MEQSNEQTNIENRRPIQSRGNPLIQKFAAYLAKKSHPTPNEISCLSAIFAALGAICLVVFPHIHFSFLLLCVLFLQLRLLCNLLDGMVAIEGGKKTIIGDIFNEFPDRIADSLLLIALGYATQLAWLGWLAALLAMMTAYIRVFGGSLGFSQSFIGPMAKQHRMAVLTISCLLSVIEICLWQSYYSLSLGLIVIVLGSIYTCVTRTKHIINQLQQKNR